MQFELLEVRNLVKRFEVGRGGLFRKRRSVHAVNGVSFSLAAGETLGLVGESGCGKTTTGRAVLRLIEPSGGTLRFQGEDVLAFDERRLKAYRRQAQIVFQDPFASLNPRMNVEEIVGEPLLIHGTGSRRERRERVADVLEKVGLEPAYMRRFPHEFSGGQRQRIGIARALTLNPKLIIADEPVSALDVSIQAQIINLLVKLQEERQIAYLFISHDLAVVEHISHRVAIMYLGRLVEMAGSRKLYATPLHPYTQALLSAIPLPNPKAHTRRTLLQGDIPSPAEPPPGCTFHTRCPQVRPICKRLQPEWVEVEAEHFAACHRL